MAQDRLNPALQWFAVLCLVGFIFGGCLWYVLPHDLHPANGAVSLAAAPPGSSSTSPQCRSPLPEAPAPVFQPPAAQQVGTVQPADAAPVPLRPDQPRIDSLPAQPLLPAE